MQPKTIQLVTLEQIAEATGFNVSHLQRQIDQWRKDGKPLPLNIIADKAPAPPNFWLAKGLLDRYEKQIERNPDPAPAQPATTPRPPTVAEIAEALGISTEQCQQILDNWKADQTWDIDCIAYDDQFKPGCKDPAYAESLLTIYQANIQAQDEAKERQKEQEAIDKTATKIKANLSTNQLDATELIRYLLQMKADYEEQIEALKAKIEDLENSQYADHQDLIETRAVQRVIKHRQDDQEYYHR